MKKLIYSLAVVLMGLTSCTSFDDPTTENYGAGPSIDVNITTGAPTDSVFTVTITPGAGSAYYAFILDENDEAEALDSAVLYKGGYGNTVVKVSDKPTTTIEIKDAAPNTTYQVYAVAGNEKGIVGNLVVKSVKTTDTLAPEAINGSSDSTAYVLTFSEEIVRGEGAVTAKYFKEWDITNPVDVPAEDITTTVEGKTATFAAANIPTGAYLCYSYEAGAFKDVTGNACAALNSGLNMNTGKFYGIYLRLSPQTFDIDNTYVTAPLTEVLITNAADFLGEISFPFDIYRNDNVVALGDLSVKYENDNRSVHYKLTPDQWSVKDSVLNFVLPASPAAGDKIWLEVSPGVIFDVYGNSNTEFNSDTEGVENWTFFAPTVDMILGTFEGSYVSYYSETGDPESLGTISIENNPEEEEGLIIKGLFLGESVLKGTYDLNLGKMYIYSDQILGKYTNSSGTTYGLVFTSTDGSPSIMFSINPDGTITADDMWGVYAYNENYEEELGWFDVAAGSSFTPAKAASRKFGFSKTAAKKVKKLSKSALNLKKQVRK